MSLLTCYQFSNANVTWANANWIWSQCSSSVAPITASVVATVGNQPGVDATTLTQPWIIEPWSPYRAGEQKDKRKKLIKLMFKMKNQQYDEEKQTKDLELSVDEIKLLLVDKNANIDLDVNLKEK